MKNMAKSRLGKELEMYINQANFAYGSRGQAVVIQQYPEITVMRSDGRKIMNGYFKKKGVTDYVGVAHGRMFAFDAKQTNESTAFPLKNIEQHQMDFLRKMRDQGAYTFLIVRFVKKNAVYIVPYDFLKPYWDAYNGDGRKSIPFNDIHLHCEQVTSGASITLNYLPLIEKRIVKGETKND